MVNLDNLEELKELDPKDVYGSTGMFASQCRQIWQLSKKLDFPQKYCKDIQNVVVCGMGGSRYGGYIAQQLFKDELKVPFLEYGDYHLPSFVDGHTLFILSSYSGGTEEPLSSAQEAISKNALMVALTSGGKAADLSKEHNFPALLFDPEFNPSGQPRLGTGYMVLGTIAILNRVGLLNISDEQINQAIAEIEQDLEGLKQNAKSLAKKIHGFVPVIVAAEFLSGNNHILRNQFNETAKSFSAYSPLPELNHHLMEGLKNPTDKKLFFLFLNSSLYSDKLKKRVELTKDVIGKNNVIFDEYSPKGSSKLSQMLHALVFGGYLTFYLALLYGQDPSLIPWVDYFKGELEKNP